MAGKIAKPFHPTGLHPDCLAARVLNFMHQNKLGLSGLAAAADVVAADCRFNRRVADAKKTKQAAPRSEDWWMEFLAKGEAIEARCDAAMAAFTENRSESDFCHEMAAVAEFLNSHSV